jgi:hypothetical protein
MWESRRLTTLWAFTACYRDSFTYFFTFLMYICMPVLTQTHAYVHYVQRKICNDTWLDLYGTDLNSAVPLSGRIWKPQPQPHRTLKLLSRVINANGLTCVGYCNYSPANGLGSYYRCQLLSSIINTLIFCKIWIARALEVSRCGGRLRACWISSCGQLPTSWMCGGPNPSP